MPKLSLNQAAKEAHKSKSALLEAIRTGLLKAYRNNKNEWCIDPDDLFEVYPQNQSGTDKENRSKTDLIDQILANERIERDRERQQLQSTIDDLRNRLDIETAERRRLTNMLAHKSTQEPTQNHYRTIIESTGTSDKTSSKLWMKLFGNR